MSEDTIKVPVDTTELDIAIAKAKQLMSMGTTITGTRDLPKGTKKLWRDWSSFLTLQERATGNIPDFMRKFGETDLPGINRELRLILGQIPGVRTLISDYFRLKRLQRSVGIATEEAKMLRDVLTHPQFILTMVATMILVMKAIATYMERAKREKQEYEEFLRRQKGLTKREFDSLFDGVGGGAGARKQYFWSLPG